MADDVCEQIETVVMEYSGPMGKFFVRKQIDDFGNKEIVDLTESEKKDLVKRIVAAAVYNEKFQKECTNRLSRMLTGTTFAV